MTVFFYVAGLVVTILGVLAIAIISGIYIAVKYFGLTLTLGTMKEERK